MADSGPLSLSEAVARFMAWNDPKDPSAFQQELQRFIRWYGRDRPTTELSPREVESYGEASGADSITTLAPVKAFLGYANKEGLTATNLAVHLKVKKTSGPRKGRRGAPTSRAHLTQEGFQRVQGELEELRSQRVHVSEEIRSAMADKDFRENAPLDAARDKQAHLEARIRDMEHILGSAEIVAEGESTGSVQRQKSRLGSRIVVLDLKEDEEISYTLVDPREIDIGKGKISVESPAGKAFLDRFAGEVVVVKAPAGALRYRIERVER